MENIILCVYRFLFSLHGVKQNTIIFRYKYINLKMIHTICRKNISLCVKYIQFFNRFLQSIHVFIIACVDLGLYKYISYLKYKRRNRGGGGVGLG